MTRRYRKVAFLDLQHHGVASRATDPGAWIDLDQDGRREIEEQEVSKTFTYGYYARQALIQRGWIANFVTLGEYSERHGQVNTEAHRRLAPDYKAVYIALHANALIGRVSADSGKYGFYGWQHNSASQNGPALARAMAEVFGDQARFPELSRVITAEITPTNGWKRAYPCIRGLGNRVVSLLSEPGFLDQKAHGALWSPEGLKRIGEALAEGCELWHKRRFGGNT